MVSAPSTAAVSNGTAIKAASRHRTRQFLRAHRDRAEPGRVGGGCGVPIRPAAGGGSPCGLAATKDRGPALAPSRPTAASEPSPAALPPARGTEPAPSAGPPLTAPAAPAGWPGFVTDRLRTTFAPRIGKPEPAHMPG